MEYPCQSAIMIKVTICLSPSEPLITIQIAFEYFTPRALVGIPLIDVFIDISHGYYLYCKLTLSVKCFSSYTLICV